MVARRASEGVLDVTVQDTRLLIWERNEEDRLYQYDAGHEGCIERKGFESKRSKQNISLRKDVP